MDSYTTAARNAKKMITKALMCGAMVTVISTELTASVKTKVYPYSLITICCFQRKKYTLKWFHNL